MPAKRLTIQQQRAVRRRLEDAETSLETYLDPKNTDCAVPETARETSRLYLDTWVLAQLKGALVTLDNALGDAS
jgi:hypothetical protein